ncbi:MAG TPA: FAD-dependent monooxygenase [Hyphomicrobiaceae bacterium]|nr:FAD-dependent monooxygenase [Hyphomicrobiaceae bacterium]
MPQSRRPIGTLSDAGQSSARQAPPRRAIIIGGSMSGLFCGLYLRRAGWAVDIFERSPVLLTGRGAGIMTHAEMHEALADLGLDTSRGFGVPLERRVALGTDGQIIAERRCPQTATSWNRLFDLLREAFGGEHYHLRKDVRRVATAEAGVTAHFTDGSSQAGDLLIGADGFRSTVRAQFLPEAQPQYAGYVAWRGLANERAAAQTLTQELFDSFVFHLPPGEQFLGYPVAGPGNDLRLGHRSWNIVWYRPADAAHELPRLLTDESGHTHGLSIPPPRIARGVIADMQADAERLLPPRLHALMRQIGQPFLQPIYDLQCPQMVVGRVALVGDAAFVVRPHVGAGILKAMQDAAALTAALETHADVQAAVAAYAAQRMPVGAAFIARARLLGSYLRYRFDSEKERRLAAAYAKPDRVMAETAVLDFLRV